MKFLFRVTVTHTFPFDLRGHNRTNQYMVHVPSIDKAVTAGYRAAKRDRQHDPRKGRVLRVVAIKEWGTLD